MNTSILKDTKYRDIVKQTIRDIDTRNYNDDIKKWEIFIAAIKAESISYSESKNKVKRKLKNTLLKKKNNFSKSKRKLVKEEKEKENENND